MQSYENGQFLFYVNGRAWGQLKNLCDRDADSSFSDEELNESDLCFRDGFGHIKINDELIFDTNVENFSSNRLRKEMLQKRS